MTDGGSWQPPDPGATTPVTPPGGALPPPTVETTAVAPASAPHGRSRGKVIAAAVGAVAIIAAGVFAITRISGDSTSGGASSPEAAANAFLDALDKEDVLGLVDVMLPGERETFRQPMQDLVKELTRLEVLDNRADLSHVSGVDLKVTDRHVEQHDTNVDDIVDVDISAKVGGTLRGKELPIGQWVRDAIGDKDLSHIDQTADPEQDTFPLAAVRQDGRWYLSAFYSIAESMRHSAGSPDIPDHGVPLVGGDSPEAAMDNLLHSAAQLDLTKLIGTLNPNEFESLQRYAPLFVHDGQAQLDQANAKLAVSDTAYDVSGSGDTRHVSLKAFKVTVDSDQNHVTIGLHDGCLSVDPGSSGQKYDSCKNGGDITNIPNVDTSGIDPAQLRDLQDTLKKVLADYRNPGITVKRVDGKWYVSPLATGFDQLLALSKALTRGEIEDVSKKVGDLITTVEDNGGFEQAIPSLPDYTRPGQTPSSSTVAPNDTTPQTTPPSSVPKGSTTPTTADATDACWAEDDPQVAADCFKRLVAAGTIEQSGVPWYLQHIECGAAEANWSAQYDTLDDAAFVALVNRVAPCFQNLVARGQMSADDLPPEIIHPECLDGRNPYTRDQEDPAVTAFYDCAFG